MICTVLLAVFGLWGGGPVEVHDDPVVRRALKPYVASGELPRAVSVRMKDGVAKFECFGGAATNEVMWMASMTKGVTAAAVLTLVDQKKLALNDRVSKFFPSFDTDEKREITVRQLLSHVSGLAGDAEIETRVRERAKTLAELPEVVAAIPLASKPGTTYAYSSIGFDLAGALVEKVVGKTFDAYLDETFFKPLGMTDTTFVRDEKRLAPYYEYHVGKPAEAKPRPARLCAYPSGGGGLYSTPNDMFVFYRMLMNNGTWEGRAYIPRFNELGRRQTPKDVATDYGLGFFVEPDGWFGHSGAQQTYGSVKPCWRRLKMVFTQMGGEWKGPWFDSWQAAVGLAFDPRARVAALKKEMNEAAKAGDVAKTQALGEEAAELDGNLVEFYLKVSEAARNAKDFTTALVWAEKAFAVNKDYSGRSFHCTAALIDSLRAAKGADATLNRLEEIVADWEKYLPAKKELTTVLSQYCYLGWRNFRYDRVRKGIAWFKTFDVPYGAYMDRSLLQIRLMDELPTFPRPESEIVFGKTLADFGVADTNVVHAKDFGWNPTNATEALQQAMDSGATTVVLDDMGAPWRISCVTNRSNQRLLFKQGASVLATQEMAELCSKKYDLFRLWKCENVILEGEGDNTIACYASDDERRKWNKTYGMCGINLSATKNVVIRNLKIANCSMDAICFSGSFPVNESTWLENLVLDSCYRQAMSICGAVDTYCKNVTFSNTRGAAPTAGIDLEPAIECYPDANLYLFDCRFEGNQGGGLVFYTSTYTPVTTYAKRCTFSANGPTPIEVFARCGIYMGAQVKAPSKIVIEDCDLETFSDTPALAVQACSLFDVTLRNCRMKDSGKLRNRKGRISTPIRFSLNRDFGPDGIPKHMVGKIRFDNVTADGWQGSPLVSFSDELGMLDIKNVLSGTIRFNGKDVDAADFEYTAPDRTAAPLMMPDLATLPPPARKVAADEVYTSNMSLSWNGAWFQSRPVYTLLYWAEAGRVVRIDNVAITNSVTGWQAYEPPNQKAGWSFKTMIGARPVYMSDVSGNYMGKFVLKDVRKGYTGYFLVPQGESALRLTWGSLDLRDPTGVIVDSAEQGVYDGRHVFTMKNTAKTPEVWSFTAKPSYSTHVLRFYRPLAGCWADDPGDLPGYVAPEKTAALVAANNKVAAGWNDQLLAEDIDWSFLSPAERAKVDGLKSARRAFAEKGSGLAALAEELAKIEEIKRNATSEANLRDANEELKNLPPLERRAALEKGIRDERDATSRLASYIRLRWEAIPADLREAAGVALVDGQVEYRNVQGLKSLLDSLR